MRSKPGFTIVELLIVIVVIAILAAITVVAFNGVQSQASDSAVQSDINQLYKKLKLAETTGQFAFENENEAQINTLLGEINLKSYDVSHGFPVIIAPHFIYSEEGNHQYSYSIAGASKSGKVYFVTEETGGVTKEISDYDSARSYANSMITMYQGFLSSSDPEPSLEDRQYLESEIALYTAKLVRIDAAEARGNNLWSLTEYPCEDWRSDPVRICLQNYDVPVQSSGSYGFAGYVYRPEAQSWQSVYGVYSD